MPRLADLIAVIDLLGRSYLLLTLGAGLAFHLLQRLCERDDLRLNLVTNLSKYRKFFCWTAGRLRRVWQWPMQPRDGWRRNWAPVSGIAT